MQQYMSSFSKVRTVSILFLWVFLLIVAILFMASCKKFTDVGPSVTSLTRDNVYADDVTAASVLTGIYSMMSSGASFAGSSGISVRSGLSADEFKLMDGANNALVMFYRNSLSDKQVIGFWPNLYNYIYTANEALEGLSQSEKLSPIVKQQLIGESKFIRAFCYFYLINLFGPVPFQETSDWRINSKASRIPVDEIYEHIVDDLLDAQNLLSANYLGPTIHKTTNERVRPTKWAATALLARVYLFKGEWANAEKEASLVINNTLLYDTVALNKVFLANSKEAIWQLQPVTAGRNTEDAYFFLLSNGATSSNPLYISDTLLNSFEVSDQRKINGNWINVSTVGPTSYYYPYKYKAKATSLINNTYSAPIEYLMMLRLAEQYLIRAEARAHQEKIGAAQEDLNVIRKRAGLSNTTAADKNSLLAATLHERQVELFSELGHRWLDIKRTGIADEIMKYICPLKGGVWHPNWMLYPLYFNDLQINPDLNPNNAGY